MMSNVFAFSSELLQHPGLSVEYMYTSSASFAYANFFDTPTGTKTKPYEVPSSIYPVFEFLVSAIMVATGKYCRAARAENVVLSSLNILR